MENEIIIYQPDETIKLDVRLEDETVWLNRHQMAQLFGRDVKTIGKHIASALSEELAAASTSDNVTFADKKHNSVVAKFATTARDGKKYMMEYYSLDVILSVGYRVKSPNGILFRRWANTVLKKYLMHGYAFNSKLNYRRTGCGIAPKILILTPCPTSSCSNAPTTARALRSAKTRRNLTAIKR